MLMTFGVGILWTLSLAALFAAAVTDFRHRIIPNRLVAVTAGCGIALRLLADPRSLAVSILAAVGLLLLLGLLAHQQAIGGGDAKVIAAVTLLVPPGRLVGLLLMIAIGGGLLSGLYLLAHLMFHKTELKAAAGKAAAGEPVAGKPLVGEPVAGKAAAGDSPNRRPLRRVGVFRFEVAKIAATRSIPYGLAVFAGAASFALTEAARWFYATS